MIRTTRTVALIIWGTTPFASLKDTATRPLLEVIPLQALIFLGGLCIHGMNMASLHGFPDKKSPNSVSDNEFFRQNPLLGQGYLHRPYRAYGHTQAASRTPLRIEQHLHRRPQDVQGAGRTDAGTSPALETFFVVPMYPCSQPLDLDTQSLQIIEPGLDIMLCAPLEFQDHHPFPLQQDIRLEDIELDIVLLDQLIYKRPVARFFWKSQNINLGIHACCPHLPDRCKTDPLEIIFLLSTTSLFVSIRRKKQETCSDSADLFFQNLQKVRQRSSCLQGYKRLYSQFRRR